MKVFWVDGDHRLKPFNFYKVDYEKGVLEETSNAPYFKLPRKQTASVIEGSGRLSISVCKDEHLIVSNLDSPDDVVQVALADDGALALSKAAKRSRGLRETFQTDFLPAHACYFMVFLTTASLSFGSGHSFG